MQIGKIRLANRLILAPMAGITDRPFRSLCRRFGAALAVSEMLSTNPALRDTRKSSERADHVGEPGPIAVQIAGADPVQMADAARFNFDQGADIIDINLGCPAKKVCKVAAGSALLRDEALVGRILEAVTRAVSIPVTLKTRTGWSPDQRNLPRIARIAREAGVAMLAVHGRTRACGYRGRAEFDSLRELCSQADLGDLVLVANGDINSPQRALDVFDHTGADAVMIGRAARGRPWIFSEIAHFLSTGQMLPEPSPQWRCDILLDHLEALYCFYGAARGVRIARKHIGWYCRDNDGGDRSALDDRASGNSAQAFLSQVNRAETARQQLVLVRHYFDRLMPTEDAA
ncbi:MAG TPA: tRNA dihydrouridine synthase DusB [Chromatiaceae bacterium]|nr:MAG: tRNA dihydrouridine synthase DusB [Thiohalocapsa sp. PB-PSB1]HBG96341.1 tRNA dihydrouridine synthase DusB [Chromatiaceae bacterium]HCS90629.1 tRNA dihydrouridine synthase DusB [Chromatiaceae bacterium]